MGTVLLIIVFILTMCLNYQTYVKDNPYEVVNIDEIKIPKKFSKSGINKKKMQLKEAFYIEHDYFQDRIILNENNVLLDGYSTYMLAKQNEIKEIEIIRDKNN